MIAAIRIRGLVGKSKGINSTFQRLRLRRKHVCVLLPERKDVFGMLKEVKDYIAYGEIDKDTLKILIEKRGRLVGNKKVENISDDFVNRFIEGKAKLQDEKIKPFFRLHPPKKGFGKGGIKKSFKEKGALGYRGKEINSLIKKML
ncbi:50S ribosomal protein L30 [Candidatus Pacearchaeota archaeon ex4484_26]|nr:MAG: 50S ribosomal protein L30 [Candidatus Pacearchaeota archaeon ex4484_26]